MAIAEINGSLRLWALIYAYPLPCAPFNAHLANMCLACIYYPCRTDWPVLINYTTRTGRKHASLLPNLDWDCSGPSAIHHHHIMAEHIIIICVSDQFPTQVTGI